MKLRTIIKKGTATATAIAISVMPCATVYAQTVAWAPATATFTIVESGTVGSYMGRLSQLALMNRGWGTTAAELWSGARAAATNSGLSLALGRLALAGIGVATAPGWVPVLVGTAITTVGSIAICEGLSYAYDNSDRLWAWYNDADFTAEGAPEYWSCPNGSKGTARSALETDIQMQVGALLYGTTPIDQIKPGRVVVEKNIATMYARAFRNGESIGEMNWSCSPYSPSAANLAKLTSGTCAVLNSVGECAASPAGKQKGLTAEEMGAKINNMDDSLKLSDEATAKLFNSAWAEATNDPNYKGVPYDPAKPVTKEEVASLGTKVTLGDLKKAWGVGEAGRVSAPAIPIPGTTTGTDGKVYVPGNATTAPVSVPVPNYGDLVKTAPNVSVGSGTGTTTVVVPTTGVGTDVATDVKAIRNNMEMTGTTPTVEPPPPPDTKGGIGAISKAYDPVKQFRFNLAKTACSPMNIKISMPSFFKIEGNVVEFCSALENVREYVQIVIMIGAVVAGMRKVLSA